MKKELREFIEGLVMDEVSYYARVGKDVEKEPSDNEPPEGSSAISDEDKIKFSNNLSNVLTAYSRKPEYKNLDYSPELDPDNQINYSIKK